MAEESRMLSVLSWDIGVKHLAYCILVKNAPDGAIVSKHGYHIRDWDLIDLFPEENVKVHTCTAHTKAKKECTRKAKFEDPEEDDEEKRYFCKLHRLERSVVIPIKKKSASARKKERAPFNIARRLHKALENKPELLNVDRVIIENQPVTMNPVMKTVQMLLFSYYSFKSFDDNICFSEVNIIHAKRKERLPDLDPEWPGSEYETRYNLRCQKVKNTYRRRKLKCLEYAKMCLADAQEYLTFLDNHNKQDDLTDTFLQATDWFIRAG